MKIILLSGGSGKRLWPLSDDTRSKQFLRLLTSSEGEKESMVQRISRQIKQSKLDGDIVVTTTNAQHDSIVNHLGHEVEIVIEPSRRNTFPAIALTAAYLSKERGCSGDEVVIVVPCDVYSEDSYFDTLATMAGAVQCGKTDMVLMGVEPKFASTTFGYIVPEKLSENSSDIAMVNHFEEKPCSQRAEKLLSEGALWNGGVFAFKLGYITQIIDKYIDCSSYKEFRERFEELPKNSFDCEIVEKSTSIAVAPYRGEWKDLGTWDNLVDAMDDSVMGNGVVIGEGKNRYIVNELGIPVVSLGGENLIIAANANGILVSDISTSSQIRPYVEGFTARPMYEERRWGSYVVLGHEKFEDGYNALTKLLNINAGSHISYQYHTCRDEIWTFVDGKGVLIIDDEKIEVGRGYVAHIKAGQKHAVMATTDLKIIEVQSGTNLIEEDIIRLDWKW
ncbi:MAG: sugar phosphate nucleotidyltransferase [Rikenellaceae bacterium]